MKSYLSILILASFLLMATAMPAQAKDPALDFNASAETDAWQWLEDKNFIMERSAANRSDTKLSFTKQGLLIEALKPSQAFIALKKGHLEHYKDVEITWGVNKFPQGASYVDGQRNEAIMLYAFFGTETVDSGAVVVPDSPYFLALQLCEKDPVNVPMKGRFFHDGGRFICVAHPKLGEVVTTRFDLKDEFKKVFGKDAPPLYGIALEFDTTSPQDDGTSSAFVQRIHFPDAEYIKESSAE